MKLLGDFPAYAAWRQQANAPSIDKDVPESTAYLVHEIGGALQVRCFPHSGKAQTPPLRKARIILVG